LVFSERAPPTAIPHFAVKNNEYKKMRGSLKMTTSIKPPGDPLQSGAV
jgi:hypothetical protein